MELLNTIISVITGKFQLLIARIRMFLNPTYLRTQVYSQVRNFFYSLFNVKPRDKDDYYTILGWMVSKKLAFSVVVIAGVLSLAYILSIKDVLFPPANVNNIKTYKYDSMLLKFAKGKVRIKGASGYLAYEGEVADGYCSGQGTLYNPDKHVVYQGTFEKSMYEGQGSFYSPQGNLRYTGNFHENLYSGTGALYRPGGSMEYQGGFELGMKEGSGNLYDTGQDMVFEGQFSKDDILFSDLLGNTPQQISSSYKGDEVMFNTTNERIRLMEDIEAMTVELNDSNSVDDEQYRVNSVFVLRDYLRLGGKVYNTFEELNVVLGDPIYEGISRATLPEVIAVNYQNDYSDQDVLYGYADLKTEKVYTEYQNVLSYDTEYEVYLHTYKGGGLVYTFVGKEDDNGFSFYYIVGDETQKDSSETSENSEDSEETL